MRRRLIQWALVAAACTLLAACGGGELYSRVSERQANEMVAVLASTGISATKSTKDGTAWSVAAPGAQFSAAIEVLHAHGYPREEFETLGRVFKREGFISSPLEERARLAHAQQQELANTILSIFDGVVTARVHLALPEKDPLADKPRAASAAVAIKHRSGVDLSSQVGQIKALVVNSIEGLPYDNVTVALSPAQAWPLTGSGPTRPVAPTGASFSQAGLQWLAAPLAAGLIGIVGGLAWRRHWRMRSRQSLSRTVATQPVSTNVPESQDKPR